MEAIKMLRGNAEGSCEKVSRSRKLCNLTNGFGCQGQMDPIEMREAKTNTNNTEEREREE
jgi:hypothetical protein